MSKLSSFAIFLHVFGMLLLFLILIRLIGLIIISCKIKVIILDIFFRSIGQQWRWLQLDMVILHPKMILNLLLPILPCFLLVESLRSQLIPLVLCYRLFIKMKMIIRTNFISSIDICKNALYQCNYKIKLNLILIIFGKKNNKSIKKKSLILYLNSLEIFKKNFN